MSIIRSIKARLGLSVTPANNFVLDASADNGTMKLARESGQDIMTVDALGKVAFPQNVDTQLGVGQTWQNLTGSRSFGTNYVNSTSKPIVVSIKTQAGAAAGGVAVGGLYHTTGTVKVRLV